MSAFTSIALIFAGGGLGSISRYGISKITLAFYDGKFPLATLTTNFLACLVLGIMLYMLKDKLTGAEWIKYFVLIGFCGGFSTFSAFGLETMKLMQEGLVLYALGNILISLLVGIGILFLIAK
jgi:fluoride exporter